MYLIERGFIIRNTFVEINLDNIKYNIAEIKKKFSGYKYYIGVVKGNAYGHGFEICKYFIQYGINYFAVSNLDEALELRKYIPIDTGIMLLNPISQDYLDICVKNNIDITIGNYEQYKKIIDMDDEIKSKIRFHLKLNTGMNRIGISDINEIENIFKNLGREDMPKLIGIYTHLATSGYMDKIYDNQIDKFIELTKNIDLKLIEMVHIFRSNTLQYHKKLEFCNSVRIGLMMYGYSQTIPKYSKGLKDKIRKIKLNYIRKKLNISDIVETDIYLKPAFTLKSEVIAVTKIKSNDIVGYGGTYKSEKEQIVAVLDVGYADGLSLFNTGRNILINEKKYKIVGTVNMGNITVIVDDNVKIGDTAIILGEDIFLKDVSKHTKQTIYVIMSQITPFIKRVYK